MRQYRNGLHVYEMLAGTENAGHGNAEVDHVLAVKEYSRSSADQVSSNPVLCQVLTLYSSYTTSPILPC